MDRRGNKKSQSPTNSPTNSSTNSPRIITDDSGAHTKTPEETSFPEQSDLIEKPESDDEEPESDDEEPEKTGGRLDNVDGGDINDALTEFLGKVSSI